MELIQSAEAQPTLGCFLFASVCLCYFRQCGLRHGLSVFSYSLCCRCDWKKNIDWTSMGKYIPNIWNPL